MRASVRGISPNDLQTWPNWTLATDADEYEWFSIDIGLEDERGADHFQVAVATYRGLNAQRHERKFVS